MRSKPNFKRNCGKSYVSTKGHNSQLTGKGVGIVAYEETAKAPDSKLIDKLRNLNIKPNYIRF